MTFIIMVLGKLRVIEPKLPAQGHMAFFKKETFEIDDHKKKKHPTMTSLINY